MLATLLLATVPFVTPPQPATTPAPPPTQCNAVPLTTEIADPPELRSRDGVLSLTLTLSGNSNPNILEGLCWWYTVGTARFPQQEWIPPTLRLHQGDTLQLTLVNDLVRPGGGAEPLSITDAQNEGMQDMHGMSRGENYTLMCGQPQLTPTPTPDPQTGRVFGYHRSPWNETNMHFHGLNVSPLQPSDDVVGVLLCPRKTSSDKPKSYTYVVNIPHDEPPGTYWYHPHPHGESDRQLISQLTGAIIIDPQEPSIVEQLKNRLIIVRDVGELGTLGTTGDQSPAMGKIRAAEPSMAAIRAAYAHGPPAMNFGPPPFRFGTPQACPGSVKTRSQTNAKVLRVNLLPLPQKPNELRGLPHAELAVGATEYWRFANTSADTILDVEQLVNGKRTPLAITSRDGVPLIIVNGRPTWQPVPMNVVRLSPGSRMEFYVHGSVPGTIVLRTKAVDTGCLGDVTLERDLLVVYVGGSSSSRPAAHAVAAPRAVNPVPIRFSDLATQIPKHHRYFVLTEYNRSDEIFPDFYVTELSNPKAIEHPYAMHGPPDVVVKSGTVEDWTILNYTQEIHEFHMHQIHFLVLKGDGIGHGAGQLLDTVDVPYGSFVSGSSGTFIPGAVTLRMDFRDPSIIGEFVYHCHILAHEDNGMMARIRVER